MASAERIGTTIEVMREQVAATVPVRRGGRPEDIAEAVAWVVGLPAHFNVNRIEMMPTCQASQALAIKRRP